MICAVIGEPEFSMLLASQPIQQQFPEMTSEASLPSQNGTNATAQLRPTCHKACQHSWKEMRRAYLECSLRKGKAAKRR
jgi:hypothetical protein